MKPSLLVAAATAAGVLTSQQPASTAQGHLAPVSRGTITTVGGLSIDYRGGCLVQQVHIGIKTNPHQFDWCDKMPAAPAGLEIQKMYAWAPDFLLIAFDNAERAICDGAIGCIARGRYVNLLLVTDGVPNAMVYGDGDQVTIALTTALLDFADAANLSYLDEVKAAIVTGQPKGGFTDWMKVLDSFAGKPCQWHLPTAIHAPSTAEFSQLRGMTQLLLELVIAHELAHAHSDSARCGAPAGSSSLDIEQACDAVAFDKLASASPPRTSLVGIVPPLVAMSHYERLLDGRLGRLFAPTLGMPSLELAPARDWSARASKLIERWERHCRTANPDPITCPPGWEVFGTELRRLVGMPLPQRCDDESMPDYELQPAGSAKIRQVHDVECSGLLELISAAPGDFAAVRAEQVDADDDDQVWEANVGFPSSGACAVVKPANMRAFASCTVAKKTDDKTASDAWIATDKKITACLGSNWSRRVKTVAGTRPTTIATFTAPSSMAAVTLRKSAARGKSTVSLRVAY